MSNRVPIMVNAKMLKIASVRLVTKTKSWQKVSSFSWGVREIYRETNQSCDVVDSSGSATDVAFSNSTERVFEVAVEYLRTMGYKFIAPKHIVIGLLTVDDGSAGRVLQKLGANLNELAYVAVSSIVGFGFRYMHLASLIRCWRRE
ncbi:chaperone protein ClpD, chloroplastic-like [Helianthus annuus]|uniref:chaperone protein ClpD, chloroplastic-like n=1 Tax=Helianthus annuus TaxID=4232 RepID=UPI001652C02F|nr:chaperone protein ClpD, chloroplastic-like [Helianthus annuus]